MDDVDKIINEKNQLAVKQKNVSSSRTHTILGMDTTKRNYQKSYLLWVFFHRH